MPSEIAAMLAQVISTGFRRKSIVTCSKWAEKCRVMSKPFPGAYSFKYFPWAQAMHDCNAEKWVGMKAAQLGFTEVALNRTFFTIDIKRVDCLYLLPSQTPDASNFSASRFDPALELSPYLNDLFGDANNVGHKRAGATNLFVRGTRSRTQLKSIPSGLIVFDELDEMTQKNLSLAEQRQAGQVEMQQIRISTPTTKGRGIDLEFEESDQQHFFFRCPACNRYIELTQKNLIITAEHIHDARIRNSHIECNECHATLPHQNKYEWLSLDRKPEWVAANQQGLWTGFHVNGLYSSSILREPEKIAIHTFEAKEDEGKEQELFNSVWGIVHEVKGARISDSNIEECIREYTLKPMIPPGSLVTLGADQGSKIHYEIDLWIPLSNPHTVIDINRMYIPKLLDEGFVHDFEELDKFMLRWQIKGAVIDAAPDKRAALDFANRFPGFVYTCFYPEGLSTRNINMWAGQPTISVDRTSWLDLSLGRFKHKQILLPKNLSEEYKKHIKAPVRKPEKDRNGNPIARYVVGERVADHLAHARNYSEIALQIALKGIGNQNTISPR